MEQRVRFNRNNPDRGHKFEITGERALGKSQRVILDVQCAKCGKKEIREGKWREIQKVVSAKRREEEILATIALQPLQEQIKLYEELNDLRRVTRVWHDDGNEMMHCYL
jgi:hypothetical protein